MSSNEWSLLHVKNYDESKVHRYLHILKKRKILVMLNLGSLFQND